MKTPDVIGWKSSYHPEPRFGRKETREECVKRLHPAQRATSPKRTDPVAEAMAALAAMVAMGKAPKA